MKNYAWIFLLVALCLFVSIGGFSEQKTTTNHLHQVFPNEIKWSSHPALPKEIQVAVIYGNPKNDGSFVMRLKIPAGSKIAPHWHPIDENITVLSGSLNLGDGDRLDQQNSVQFPVGSFASIPAKHHHYAWFSEDTILQLNNYGRWEINYVNPNDDPRNTH